MTHLLEWPKSRALSMPSAGDNVGQWGLAAIAGGCTGGLTVSSKTKRFLTVGPGSQPPWCLPEAENWHPHKHGHGDVYSCFTHVC